METDVIARPARIAIIDDEQWIREYLKEILSDFGYEIDLIMDDPGSLEKITTTPYDIIIADLMLQTCDGLEVLEKAAALPHRPEVLLMTRHDAAQNAAAALELGVFDFLGKPLESSKVARSVMQALEHRRLKDEIRRLQTLRHPPSNLHISPTFRPFHDVVTELPNRTLFFDRLEQAIIHQKRRGGVLAVLCMDIDGFGRINDVHGSDVGDQVLAETGRKLKQAIREHDTVSRIGNDEFGLVAWIGNDEEVRGLLERIITATASTATVDGQEILLSLSIGAALCPDDGVEAKILVKKARAALENAKGDARGSFQIFTPEKHQRVKELISTELMLAKGLDDGKFALHFQPYFDIQSGRPAGVEALLRWREAGNGSMNPDEFIPVLEETKLILAVGEWIARTVCEFINRNRGLSVPVAMNVSAVQLQHEEHIQRIAETIQSLCCDPSKVAVELTESLFVKELDKAKNAIEQLRGAGCLVAIDDFGSGHASINYLKEFAFDILKIDKSFIRDIGTNADDRSIVTAIVAMAKAFKLRTIAEGVETETQLHMVKDIGCDISQGYYHASPMPEQDLLTFLGIG